MKTITRANLAEAIYAQVGLVTAWKVTEEEARRRGFAFLLRKPFSVEALIDTKLHWQDHIGEPMRPHDRADLDALRALS